MKLSLLVIGKEKSGPYQTLINDYAARIGKMYPFTVQVLKSEAHLQKKIPESAYVIALDEHGKQSTSVAFSKKLQQYFNSGHKHIVWIIGGPWGLGDEIKQQSRETMALSSMTLAHELAQLLFTEQLYRALTILKGTPYHHE